MANELPGIPPGIDLMQIPASPLPPGVKSDFNKREPLLDATIALTAVFLPLMYVFFGLRVYVRLRHSQKWMIDDSESPKQVSKTDVRIQVATATITALSTTALAVVTLLLAPKMAKHFWDLPVGVLRSPTTQKVRRTNIAARVHWYVFDSSQTMVAQVIFLSSSAFLGKHCLLTIYYRIFGHIPKVRWQLLGTAILTLPLFSGIIVYPILVGPPVGKPWGTPHPKEADAVIPNLMMGIDNIPVDLCIAYIPIPVIQTLKLSTTRKRGIVALFTTGFM